MSETPAAHLSEEPQAERGAPGSRDTGSNEPAGGPADRPAGTTADEEDTAITTDATELGGTGSIPPQDTGSAMPPYEGRRESADVDTSGDSGDRDGANVAGATGPVVDEERKAPEPSGTPRGAVASPADEQPATPGAEGEPAEPGVGPSHSAGTTRAEDQS